MLSRLKLLFDPGCLNWCESHGQGIPDAWRTKCTWESCGGCPQCSAGNPPAGNPPQGRRSIINFSRCTYVCIRHMLATFLASTFVCAREAAYDHVYQIFGSRASNPSLCLLLERPANGACRQDADCGNGSYCSSRNVCTRYFSEYCDSNSCGLGDGGSCPCMH